jgi:hypothetical protein
VKQRQGPELESILVYLKAIDDEYEKSLKELEHFPGFRQRFWLPTKIRVIAHWDGSDYGRKWDQFFAGFYDNNGFSLQVTQFSLFSFLPEKTITYRWNEKRQRFESDRGDRYLTFSEDIEMHPAVVTNRIDLRQKQFADLSSPFPDWMPLDLWKIVNKFAS